jgi:hypothetical protein
MIDQPAIETARLVLCPWTADDAPALWRLAGRREIADTMISIPHPYGEEQARAWIAGHADALAQGYAVHFAIQLKRTAQLIGATEFRSINMEHAHAELSLWIGVDWWGQQRKPLHDPRTPAGREALKVETKADWDDVLPRALARMNPAQKRLWLNVASNLVELEKTQPILAYREMASNSVVLLNWMRTGRFEELRL